MTTTIDTNGHIVADTNTQQTAQTIADAVKLFAYGIPADGMSTTLMLQPERNGDIAWVDAVAAALGLEPETSPMPSGDWHRTARGHVGEVFVSVLTGDAEPVEAKRERLAAELAAIDAQIATNGHGEASA